MKHMKSGFCCTCVIAMLLLSIFTGCGSDNNNDNGTGPGGSVAFLSDNANPGPNSVTLRQQSATSSSLILDVAMVQVQNVYGAAFEIRYPSGVIRYTGYASGDFLSGDGAPVSIQVAENPAGVLIIGATRLGDAGGINGSGNLLSLRFEPVATGSGRVDFQNASLRDPNNNIIPGVNFLGGSVSVVM